MAHRAYFSQWVAPQAGTRFTNTYRPAIILLGVRLELRHCVDGRSSPTGAGPGQEMFCIADVTNGQHAILAGDPRVTYLPIEDASGLPVGLRQPVGAVAPANRLAIRNLLAARHIPDDGIQVDDSIAAILRRVALRFVVRDILRADDMTEGLDTLISAIPAAKRLRIRTALEAREIDFSEVLGTDTVREALVKIVSQNRAVFRVAAA